MAEHVILEGKIVATVRDLQYTRSRLIALMAILLAGDFVMVLMGMLVPNFVPLQLKDGGATAKQIGLIMSILAILNPIVNPYISFKSDNFRSARGRRIPYMRIFTPICAACLLVIPLVSNIWVMAGMLLFFQVANLVTNVMYYALFADVVPENYMGRFMGMFRVIGAAASFLFIRYALGMYDGYLSYIYWVCASVYFFGFMGMCLWIYEGKYPPPLAKRFTIKGYIQGAFHSPVFNLLYAATAIASGMAWVPANTFMIFFRRDTLGLSLETVGQAVSWGMLIPVILFYPFGELVDRIGGFFIWIFGVFLMAVTAICSYYFVQGETSLLIWWIVFMVFNTLLYSAQLPLFVKILAKDRYAQYCAAQAILNSIGVVVGLYVLGWIIELAKARGSGEGAYRIIWIWMACWYVVAALLMIVVRTWHLKSKAAEKQNPPGGLAEDSGTAPTAAEAAPDIVHND